MRYKQVMCHLTFTLLSCMFLAACGNHDSKIQIFTENTRAIAHLAQYFGDMKVTTLFDKSAMSLPHRVAVGEPVNTARSYQDRYHKDRRDRPIR